MFIGQVHGSVKSRYIELEEKCPEIPVAVCWHIRWELSIKNKVNDQ